MTIRYLKHAFAVILLCLLAVAVRAEMPEVTLTIGGHKLTAEVAHTDADRTQGLMNRRMMPENRGMLFIFPQTGALGFWMMNTHIPLSIAFLDEAGAIINIADMKPLTTDIHHSARPARYALEMNLGWFAKRGIKPGAKIEGLARAPAAK